MFTNLKAGRIVDMEDRNIEEENARIEEFLKSHKDSYVCPIDKPYAIDDKVCGVCPILFSYSSKKCT